MMWSGSVAGWVSAMSDDDVVVCVKAHESTIHGGEVPEGSRWHADDPVVKANRSKFGKGASKP
jgi:hypothetical protein